MIVILLTTVLLLCAYIFTRKRKVHECPPIFSGVLPVIGHAHRMVGDSQFLYHRVMSMVDECNKNGGVMLLKIGTANYYVLTDPDDFTTAANQCLKTHFSYAFINPFLGDGLITGTDVGIWRRHRKILSPAFGQHVLDGFIDVFNVFSQKLVEDLAVEVNKGPFDHSAYIDRSLLETVCKTSFGLTTDDVHNFDPETYLKAVNMCFHLVTKRIQQWWLHSDLLYRFSKQKKEMDDVSRYLNSISRTVLEIKKKNLSKTGDSIEKTKFKAFMDLAIELADKGELTDTEVYQEMNTIIAAGYETSGSALMYTIALLGTHTEVQERVLEEMQLVFGDSSRYVEKHDLGKLVYMEAVLKESMRLYTITPSMFRTVETDVKLKNYTMPAGSHCLLLVCGLHLAPCWGPDAAIFRPDRWLDGSLSENTTTKAFAAFGVGKRLCLGKTFAMMSMKTALVHILRCYRVSSDVTKLKFKMDPLLKPVSGHQISLQLRTHRIRSKREGA